MIFRPQAFPLCFVCLDSCSITRTFRFREKNMSAKKHGREKTVREKTRSRKNATRKNFPAKKKRSAKKIWPRKNGSRSSTVPGANMFVQHPYHCERNTVPSEHHCQSCWGLRQKGGGNPYLTISVWTEPLALTKGGSQKSVT